MCADGGDYDDHLWWENERVGRKSGRCGRWVCADGGDCDDQLWGGERESGSEEWHVWTMGVGDGCWRWVLAMGDNDVDEEVIMMDD